MNEEAVCPLPEMRFEKNRLGGDALFLDGHKYRVNRRNSDGTVYWRCFFRWCQANAVVSKDNQLKSVSGTHICSEKNPTTAQRKTEKCAAKPIPKKIRKKAVSKRARKVRMDSPAQEMVNANEHVIADLEPCSNSSSPSSDGPSQNVNTSVSSDQETPVVTSSDSITISDSSESSEDSDKAQEIKLKDLLKHHQDHPPKAQPGQAEECPATTESLAYFKQVLLLKTSKFHNISKDSLPDQLKKIPFALDYGTFLRHYWPGSFNCCGNHFPSSKSYRSHFSTFHLPPFPPPNFSLAVPKFKKIDSEMEDSDCTPVFEKTIDGSRKTGAVGASKQKPKQTSSDNSQEEPRKRRTLSPASRPGPKRYKQALLSGPSMVKIGNPELLNSLVDSDREEPSPLNESRPVGRPKRTSKPRQDSEHEDESDDLKEKDLAELEKDQKKYPPQHEPGKEENFPATVKRIKYFSEVLALKLKKYNRLNSYRPNSPMHSIPLALTIAGFTHYYWPGRVLCCGLERKSVTDLEKHINRAHRPPNNPLPSLTLPPCSPSNEDDDDDEVEIEEEDSYRRSKSFDNSPSSKLPAGLSADQNMYPPQHKPGDPEDFKANEATIDYFLSVVKLKREKYSHINMKDRADAPLSLPFNEFVHYYWPGVLSCCYQVFSKCNDFEAHLRVAHGPRGKAMNLSVVSGDIPTSATEEDEVLEVTTRSVSPPRQAATSTRSTRRNRSSTGSQPSTSLDMTVALGVSPSPSKRRSGRLSAENATDFAESTQEEARQLRRRLEQVSSIPGMMPVLQRILELAAALAERLRSIGTDRDSRDDRSSLAEGLEYVWNASKKAIVRWEELKGGGGHRDAYLSAVQYAYGTLPVFINWDQAKHLDDVENVVTLSLNTVKRSPGSMTSSPGVEKTAEPPKQAAPRRATTKQDKADKTTSKRGSLPADPSSSRRLSNASQDEDSSASTQPPLEQPKKEQKVNMKDLQDFCRQANIAVSQNTKNRAGTGYKDNDGNFHPMYRYGISQILKLYCPSWVTHLKCCDRVFDVNTLRVHVLERHEAPGKTRDRTDSSIEPHIPA